MSVKTKTKYFCDICSKNIDNEKYDNEFQILKMTINDHSYRHFCNYCEGLFIYANLVSETQVNCDPFVSKIELLIIRRKYE